MTSVTVLEPKSETRSSWKPSNHHSAVKISGPEILEDKFFILTRYLFFLNNRKRKKIRSKHQRSQPELGDKVIISSSPDNGEYIFKNWIVQPNCDENEFKIENEDEEIFTGWIFEGDIDKYILKQGNDENLF
jgi:hypothetical protein